MIDIHNHIIFDVDDGSRDLEQSIRMIKAAKEAGYTEICFTPHYMEDGYKTKRTILEEKVEEIRDELKKENVDIKLYLGEEIFIFPSLPESLDKVICLNDSRYILIEFPLVEEISFIDDVIYQLMTLGKVPIIAHPERYFSTEKDFSFVERLVQKGVLLQVNINSLVGHYGKPAKNIAIKLLKKNMVHFLGSDAHSSAGYRKITESMEALRKIVSHEKVEELLETNPRKVFNNEEIEIDTMAYENEWNEKKSNWLFSTLFRKVGQKV